MIGLTLALFYGLVLVAFGKQWPDAYLRSTRFLTRWSVAVALFVCLVVFFASSLGGFLGGLLSGTSVGFLVGWFGLGLVASGMLLAVLVLALLQVLGAYLLSTSLFLKTGESSGYEWQRARLIIGSLFFVVGLSKGVLG